MLRRMFQSCLMLHTLLLLIFPVAHATLNISGVWTADNSAEYFVNGIKYAATTKSWSEWNVPKQIGPIILENDHALVHFIVTNHPDGSSNNNNAAFFAHILVNGNSYSVTGDDTWLSTEGNMVTLQSNTSLFRETPKFCDTGNPSIWERFSRGFTSNMTIEGIAPRPIWGARNRCTVGDVTKTFALAISSNMNASEAKTAWISGSLDFSNSYYTPELDNNKSSNTGVVVLASISTCALILVLAAYGVITWRKRKQSTNPKVYFGSRGLPQNYPNYPHGSSTQAFDALNSARNSNYHESSRSAVPLSANDSYQDSRPQIFGLFSPPENQDYSEGDYSEGSNIQEYDAYNQQ